MTSERLQRQSGRGLVTVIGSLGAVFVGIAGFGALSALRPAPEIQPPAVKKYNIDVFVVETHCLQETISGFGTALPDQEVVISAQVAGQVMPHELEVGDKLAAKQPILEIDARIYEQRYEQVKAQLAEGDSELRRLRQEQTNTARMLAQAKTDYETATQQYQRRQSLKNRELVTPDELTRALLELRQYEQAKMLQENEADVFPFRIEQVEKRQTATQTALELAQIDLDHTKVLSPFTGVVSEVFAETGQYVRVGDPLMRITNTTSVEIPVPVTLSDYAKLAPRLARGETPGVQLASDVNSPSQWTGKLTRSAPKADRENRTIEVFIEVDNTSQPTPLLPGSFVHARIEGPIHEHSVAIPRDAIINNHVLIANPEGKPHIRQLPIEVAETMQNLAIVSEGLPPGERLILTNLDVLFRSPSSAATVNEDDQLELAINREHRLEEFLEDQTHSLISIHDCPPTAGSASNN